MPAILLTENAKGFKLDLNSGFNVVDFVDCSKTREVQGQYCRNHCL